MNDGTQVTVVNTEDLKHLISEAIRLRKNRQLEPRVREMLDPEGIHLIVFSMVHNDVEIRVRIAMKFKDIEEPVFGMLDMSFENFNALARLELRDGQWERVKV